MPAARSDKNFRKHKQSVQSANGMPQASGDEPWVAKDLGGDYPPLNAHSKSFVDPRRGKIYIYGGSLTNDDSNMPTSYLHVLDTNSMEFTDLTNGLRYITPGDLYSEAMRKRETKTLPSLSQPGVTFLELEGIPMIFIFGGYDSGDVDAPSSTLIAINTEHKEWYYVEFEENEFPQPAPRIAPVLVGVNGRLYIFSGIMNFGDHWVYHRTFSIVDFQLGHHSHKCKWMAVDSPYPDNIPAEFEEGLPVLYGHMIILFPGREQSHLDTHFKEGHVVYFFTKKSIFAQANVEGVLPKGIVWYFASNLDPAPTLPKGPSPPSSCPSKSLILLCTWQRHGADNDLVPEFWLYTLTDKPNDTLVRLGFADKVSKLNKNLQHFSLVGGRGVLMGSSKDSDAKEMIMIDTYVEIPVQQLVRTALPIQN